MMARQKASQCLPGPALVRHLALLLCKSRREQIASASRETSVREMDAYKFPDLEFAFPVPLGKIATLWYPGESDRKCPWSGGRRRHGLISGSGPSRHFAAMRKLIATGA